MSNQPLLRQFRLWMVLVVMVPCLLIMAIYSYGQLKVAKLEKLEVISQRMDFQKRTIEYWLAERAADVRTISRLQTLRGVDLQQLEQALAILQREKTDFDSLSYIDKDGIFRISTLRGGVRFPKTSDQPYFLAARVGKEFISDVAIGRNSGVRIINFSAPIYDTDGVFQGLILGSVRTTLIEALLQANWIGRTGEIYLINREGKLIADPHHADRLAEKGFDGGGIVQMPAGAFPRQHYGENGRGSWVNYLGDTVLATYRYMPERGWMIIGTINEEEILAPIYRQLMLMTGSTFLLILTFLSLSARLTNRVKRPIEWLIKQSDYVASEKYELVGQDKRLGKTPQELEALCDSFVGMSRNIAKNVNLIKDHKASLESKVLEIERVNAMLGEEVVERQKAQLALEELNTGLEREVSRRAGELRKREQNYRTLVENLPDCICRFDQSHHPIYANPAFINDAGMPSNLAIDDTWDDGGLSRVLYSPWADRLAEVFAAGRVVHFESQGGRNDSLRSYSIRFIPEYNSRGEVESVLCMANDITEVKRLEADMARLGRLNLVGEVAVGIGHELRNPMTTVRGYLQLFLQKEIFANYRGQLSLMIEELDTANGIITEFLSLAKDKSVEMQIGSLNQALTTLYPLLQVDATRRGHEIRLNLGEIPESYFDEKEIWQLVANLVRNGCEAMLQPGIVTIRTAIEQEDIILSIEDHGTGIAPELMDKLGTPFVTTKENGIGLGLPICYRIAQRHAAKIDVLTSTQGTTFKILFPVRFCHNLADYRAVS